MFKRSSLRLLVTLLFVMSFSCSERLNEDSLVHISGKLINWGNASKILSSESIEGDFGLGLDLVLTTDDQGKFELSFSLNEATYYSLGRNKLYLQPGDELYLEVDFKDPKAGKFDGDGAEMQQYLSGVAFPKSGSYLSGGQLVKSPEISPIIELATMQTETRRSLLEGLQNASAEFMNLERMRLKLDYLNTILSFPIYGSFKDFWQYSEDKRVEVLLEAKDELNMAGSDLMKDEYMKHPNFRDMLLTFAEARFHEAGIFSELKLTPLMEEYDEMGAFTNQLQLNGLTEDMQQKVTAFMDSDISQAYRDMAKRKVEEYSALTTGSKAFDVKFKTVDEVPVALSKFKGKLIYVDLWATWCGPCIDELPAFEQLKKDYVGKDITFLPVSIDTDVERWKKYLEKHELTKNELIINRLDLADYKVITIPRYLLIDKDFKIISVFAPKPSLPETKELIDQYL